MDMFKPVYKRDRKLASSTQCADILDLQETVCQYWRNVDTAQDRSNFTTQVFSAGGYTLHVSPYRPVGGSATGPAETFQNYIKSSGVSSSANWQVVKAPRDLVQISVKEMPGILIVPNMVPPAVQCCVIEEIVRDLIPDLRHRNNLDIHYDMGTGLELFPDVPTHLSPLPEPIFMGVSPAEKIAESASSSQAASPPPQRPAEPLAIDAVRSKKLRWITLGGQYNWTTKVYPSFDPHDPSFPPFPANMATLFSPPLFDLVPEAAIINFYSPGDTLSPHQDVAEMSDADLASVSLGCEAVFYVGLHRYKMEEDNSDVQPPLQVLLRSGDAVVMGGASRHAYHGVGRVWANTCPKLFADMENLVEDASRKRLWARYAKWMENKRVNINVRQMVSGRSRKSLLL